MNAIKKFIYNNIIPAIGRICIGRNQYVNVIYYHDIVQGGGYSYMRTNADTFKSQMQYIATQGYETLRFDDLQDKKKLKFKKKRVLIAFDDGWKSNYTEIYQFMKSLGLHYNVFLAVGLIGNDDNYLNWDMVREMHQSGICGFGTHTYNHVDASELTDNSFAEEITKADDVFSRELGFDSKDFCYPYGRYSRESLMKLERESGYERLYTSSMLYSYLENGKKVMGRNGISQEDDRRIFTNKLNGYYNAFNSIVRR